MSVVIRSAVPIVSAGEGFFARHMYDSNGGPAEEDKHLFEIHKSPGTNNVCEYGTFKAEFYENKLIWNKFLSAKKRHYRKMKKKQDKIKSKIRKGAK